MQTVHTGTIFTVHMHRPDALLNNRLHAAVFSGWGRGRRVAETSDLVFCSKKKKRVIFSQSEGFSVFNAKTIPEHERLQICPYRCVIATCNFSTSPLQYTHTHKHPLILPFHSRINPPLHHPLILRPSTYVAHEKWEGGWERRWMKRGAENEREWGGGGGEKSKIGKNALWLDLKVCGISFSERGELHLLQIL